MKKIIVRILCLCFPIHTVVGYRFHIFSIRLKKEVQTAAFNYKILHHSLNSFVDEELADPVFREMKAPKWRLMRMSFATIR